MSDEVLNMTEAEKMHLIFAKALASQSIHDPAGKQTKRRTRKYRFPTKDDIEGYLESPTANEKNLRDASIYLYQTNTRYRNLINYYAEIPCWIYVISPLNYNPDKVKKNNFEKQYYKTCNILESMCIPAMMREIVTTALREGVYYGVAWGGDGNQFFLQKLDPDYCTIINKSDGGVFNFAYDMSKVNPEDLDAYYPPEFKKMYQEYEKTSNQYQPVPPEISFCLKSDPSIPDYSIPGFCGSLPLLYQIRNVEQLSESATELQNYKLLAGQIPLDEKGIPLLNYELAMQYYQHLANNVGDRVGVAMTPFNIKDFSFEKSGTAAQVDEVARTNENFFSSAGTSALLHGAINTTSGVTKLSVKVDEALAFGFMYQCEEIVNRYLKLMPGTIKFKIHFLDVSCFNHDDKVEEYRSALNYGIGKLEFLAVMGIRQFDFKGENYIENEILNIDETLTPLKTSSTRSAEENSAGRPASDDDDITDEGEATRDGDQNDNR